jgi:hypothetical protein
VTILAVAVLPIGYILLDCLKSAKEVYALLHVGYTLHDGFQSNVNRSERFLQSSNLICPYPNGSSKLLSSGPVHIQKSPQGILCTLTAASYNESKLTSILPLARSYDGFEWERAAGVFATEFYRNNSWSCDSVSCQIVLPQLPNNMTYRLASYTHSLAPRDEIARFLETTTFGVTQSDLESFFNITENGNITGDLKARMARWISTQMNASRVGITSHREYWRTRANSRVSSALHRNRPLYHSSSNQAIE